MTDRSVLMMVDAGFFWQALLGHLGKSQRNEVSVDYDRLCEVLATLAEGETGARLLRQTWYDACHRRKPTAEHRKLSAIAGVHVRLGWLVMTSSGFAQKAVDTAIVRDIVVAAQRRSVDELVLIGGDGDLVPGVAQAVECGIKINLWGVSVNDPRVRQSDELVALADRRLTIDLADIEAHVKSNVEPAQGGQAPSSELVSEVIDADAAGNGFVQLPVPLFESAEEAQPTVGSPVVLDLPASPPGADARLGPPPLSGLAVAERLDLWRTADAGDPMSPKSFGARYCSRWTALADNSMRSRLRDAAQPPGLPRLLEADLLKFAGELGLDTEDKGVRHNLRVGFWEGLRSDAFPS